MRRGLAALLSWLGVTLASFAAIHALPGDPVEAHLLRLNAAVSPDTVAALQAQWGLDRPLPVQYGLWLAGIPAFDWGRSFETGGDIAADLARRLPWSAAIGIGGLGLGAACGCGLGFAAALRPGGMADRLSRILAVAGQAVPAFAAGLVLLWVLAAQLQLIRPFSGGLAARLLLPVLLVALFQTGSLSRLARAGFDGVRRAPFYRTALAKGLGPGQALWRHGRRHAALVLLAGIAPDLAWVIGGTAVAEIVFGVPGLSERVVQAVSARDYPVIQAYVALVAAWLIPALALSGWLGRGIDPRTR